MKDVEKHVFFELYNRGKRIGTFDCYVHGDTEAAAWEEARTLGVGMLYGIDAIRRYRTRCPLFVYEEGCRDLPYYKMDSDYRDERVYMEYAQPIERNHNEITF